MNLNPVESLIKVQKEQVAPGITVPTQVNFYFTPSSLETIISQKKSFQRLNLSPELLADLRYYSLRQNRNSVDFTLVFTTYYTDRQQSIAVIKSTISLDGRVSQQVCRSFFQDVYLLKNLVASHYWLIGQLCDSLTIKYRNKISLLALVLSLIIFLILVLLIVYFISFPLIVKLVILILILFFLYWTLKLILNKYFANFMLQQLLFGFSSKNTARRRFAIKLLSYFA